METLLLRGGAGKGAFNIVSMIWICFKFYYFSSFSDLFCSWPKYFMTVQNFFGHDPLNQQRKRYLRLSKTYYICIYMAVFRCYNLTILFWHLHCRANLNKSTFCTDRLSCPLVEIFELTQDLDLICLSMSKLYLIFF